MCFILFLKMDKNQIITIFLLCSVLVQFSSAEDPLYCESIRPIYTNPKDLSLLYDGDITSFEMKNTEKIISTTNDMGSKIYINARFDNNNLTIFTTEAFKNYAREQNKQTITLTIQFKCTTTSKNAVMIFVQNIDKANVYEPEFSKNEYKFLVPLPLYENCDLSMFQEISATDYDVYDNKITFSSSDSELVEIGTKSNIGSDQRTHYAFLRLQKPLLNITQSLKFTITAKDNGKPPKSSKVIVIITANETNTFPPQPSFERAFYEGQLSIHNSNWNLVIPDNPTLEKGTFTLDVDFYAENNENGLFVVRQIDDKVSIELTRNLTPDDIKNRDIFGFILIARNPKASVNGRTAIIIHLPKTNELFDNASSNNTVGYLVAIIILLILLFGVTGFLIWRMFLRYKIMKYNQMQSSITSSTISTSENVPYQENKNSSKTNHGFPTETKIEVVPDGVSNRQTELNKNLVTILKQHEEPNQKSDLSENLAEESKRKSVVTFDDKVRKIDSRIEYESDGESVRL